MARRGPAPQRSRTTRGARASASGAEVSPHGRSSVGGAQTKHTSATQHIPLSPRPKRPGPGGLPRAEPHGAGHSVWAMWRFLERVLRSKRRSTGRVHSILSAPTRGHQAIVARCACVMPLRQGGAAGFMIATPVGSPLNRLNGGPSVRSAPLEAVSPACVQPGALVVRRSPSPSWGRLIGASVHSPQLFGPLVL